MIKGPITVIKCKDTLFVAFEDVRQPLCHPEPIHFVQGMLREGSRRKRFFPPLIRFAFAKANQNGGGQNDGCRIASFVLFFLLPIAFCLMPNFLFSQELTYPELLQKIDEKDKEINNLKFNFIQETEIKLTKEKQKIYGSVIYQKPKKLYLEIEPVPENIIGKQIVISDGKKVWLYTPSYKQVIEESWSGLAEWERYGFIPKEIFNFVDSVKKLEKNYQIEFLGKEETSYLLLLKPRKMSNIQIKFWISQETYLPVKSEIESETFILSNQIEKIEINTQPDEKIFQFKIPKGVEILRFPFK